MIDPPPFSGRILQKFGIEPGLIKTIILTHCHADHDAGTFQKILQAGRVTVMTTKTVIEMFLRKYTKMSGLKKGFLRRLFEFREAPVQHYICWQGAQLRFFYSLHAVPCVGLEVKFRGRSMAYSGDTFYDPPALRKLHEKGVLSAGRLEALLAFPFQNDVVLHECGIPPIHTPPEALKALPPEQFAHLYAIHIATAKAEEYGLRLAKAGVENTINLAVPECHIGADQATGILQKIAAVDIFADLDIHNAVDVLQNAQYVEYPEGAVLCKEGDTTSHFLVIMHGNAEVRIGGALAHDLKLGDYVGERAALTGEPRTATIVAVGGTVETLEFSRSAFNLLLRRQHNLYHRLKKLAHSRDGSMWKVWDTNSLLRSLSFKQKAALLPLLSEHHVTEGEILWSARQPVAHAFIVLEGELAFKELRGNGAVAPFRRGALLADMRALRHNHPARSTLLATSDGKVLSVRREHFLKFLDMNPGVDLLFCIHPLFVE